MERFAKRNSIALYRRALDLFTHFRQGAGLEKIALITGGAKRLGRDICLSLAKEGFDIALHYHTSTDAAEQTRKEIKGLGRRCFIIQSNLNEPVLHSELIDAVYHHFGNLTLLINNASIFKKLDFKHTSPMDFDQNVMLHMKAPFFLSQAFSKKCQKGAIINMLDTRVDQYKTEHFVYTLSKKSLKEMTLLLAKTLAPDIRVNGICPGAILPPENQGEQYLEQLAQKTPMKHPGHVQDILSALLYLTRSNYVNGEILYVDGGERLT